MLVFKRCWKSYFSTIATSLPGAMLLDDKLLLKFLRITLLPLFRIWSLQLLIIFSEYQDKSQKNSLINIYS